jgi:replication factor C small subunit
MRTKIKSFSSSVSFKKMKIVILDESDYITPNAQAALRNIMETFSKTTRFILTCNYADRIIEPVQSRCQTFEIYPPNKSNIAKHVHGILQKENIDYEQSVLAEIVNSYYPDLRKIINCIQKQSVTGKLVLDEITLLESDYKQKILQLLKKPDKKTWKAIRQVVANNKVRDFSTAYRFLYDKVEDYTNEEAGQVLLIIAQYQHWDSMVVDKEINFMACIVSILDSNG